APAPRPPFPGAPMPDELEPPDPDLPIEDEFPVFPAAVKVAGALWILFGGVLLLYLVFLLLVAFGVVAAPKPRFGLVEVCFDAVLGLIGTAFLSVGVQSVRGTASDTLGSGIGSVPFGLFLLAGGVAGFWTNPIAAVVYLPSGAGMLVAGVLALIGHRGYKAWR